MGNEGVYYHATKLTYILFFIYCFFSIFEGYISGVTGPIVRYYLILMIIYLAYTERKFLIGKRQIMLIIWLLFYIASLIWTPNFNQAMTYVFTVAGMTVLLLLIMGIRFDLGFSNYVLQCMTICSLLLGLLGLFFSQDYLGRVSSRQVLSLFGVQIDPNNLVALYAIGAGMGLYYIIFSDKKITIKITYGILSLVNVYDILMTGSRSGIVVIISIAIILIFGSGGSSKSKYYLFKKIAILILIIALMHIFIRILPSDVWDRISGKDLSFTDSTGRTERWRHGLQLWWNTDPLFGCGWGAYECHGTFFTFLVDTGIVGSGLFWGNVVYIFIKCFKLRRTDALVIMASGLIPAFFIGAQNKRFFWNAIILPEIIINEYEAFNHECDYGIENS